MRSEMVLEGVKKDERIMMMMMMMSATERTMMGA